MMRYLTILEPIGLSDIRDEPIMGPTGQVFMTHVDFLRDRLLDQIFGQNTDTLAAAMRIKSILKTVHVGDVMAIESSDWDILLRAVRTPSNAYNPMIALNILPFIDSVAKAPESPPNRLIAKAPESASKDQPKAAE